MELKSNEDNSLNNITLLLGILCCTAAAVAHFYPIPFPDNRSFLLGCVIAYIVFNSILQYLLSYVQQNRILKTQKNDKGEIFEVSTSLVKYSPEFTITLVITTEPKKSSPVVKRIEKTFSVCEFFEEDGTFVRQNLNRSLETLKNQKTK